MLTIEQFAVLRATLEAGRPRDEVLREAGLTPATWVQLQRHWLTELARASARRSSDLATRYQSAFARAAGGGPEPAPHVTNEVVAEPAIANAPAPVVPSYLRAAAVAQALHTPSPRAAYAVDSPQVAPPPPVVMQVEPTRAQPPLAAPHVPVGRVPLSQRGTMAVSSAPLVGGASPSATPFVQGAAPVPSPRPAGGVPLSERRAALTGTALASDERPRPALTGTALATGAEGGVASPFGARARPAPALPDGVPAMSLQQYAWLSATLKSAPPGELPSILAKVRLTTETRQLLEEHWRARFDAEPALRQAFMPLFAKFVAQGRT